jgi:hypothetical protein
MSSHGVLTAKIGDFLETSLDPKIYNVLYDHGKAKANVGKIISWFGEAGRPQRATELAQLDIAVVEHKTQHVLILSEIEETNDTPKGLIADAFATLMGDKVTFGERDLEVGVWTTLLILGRGPREHGPRNLHLSDHIEACRRALPSGNASIGHTIIQSFQAEADLTTRVLNAIPSAAKPA